MKRGSSQARVTIENDHVRKVGLNGTEGRVRDQGIWLRKYDESPCLPAVNEVYSNGYLMEKLDEIPLSFEHKDVLETCAEILVTLDTQLWSRKFDGVQRSLVPWNGSGYYNYDSRPRNVHRKYVVGLLNDVKMTYLRWKMRQFEDRINWNRLQTGLTHGDPIIDNLMHRPKFAYVKSDPQLVLIDPIPACPAIPDVLAVDVGRVIQSAVGYEALRYADLAQLKDDFGGWGDKGSPLTTHDAVNYVLNDVMNNEFTLDDARASIYFAIIHMMRGVRTAQRVAPDRVVLLRGAVIYLVVEAEQWMR